METEINRALTNILDYVEEEERRDYEKSPDDDHIYLDVCFVRGWLDAAVKHEGVSRIYRIPVTELLVSHATVTVRARSADEAREKVDRARGGIATETSKAPGSCLTTRSSPNSGGWRTTSHTTSRPGMND